MIHLTILNFLKKYGIYIIAFIGFPIALYFIFRKDDQTKAPPKPNNADFNTDYAPPSLTVNEAGLIATRIQRHLEGITEDERSIMELLLPLTVNDYKLVYDAFGIRKITSTLDFISPLHYFFSDGSDLNYYLVEYLEDTDIQKIKHLIY